tara:strand:- start:533 stop:1399 length:867 start_codon:yes stop_codon:yes gene_type:complete
MKEKNYETLAEEVQLRKLVRKAIRYKIASENKSTLIEEQKLRNIIRHLILEAKEIDADGNPTPYGSTPLVFLADAFNEILKTVKDGLRSLQKPEERASYRLNMLEKFKNFFAKAEGFDTKKTGAIGESDINEEENLKVTLDLDDDARVMPSDESENERFKPQEKSEEERAEEDFETERVQGTDNTGAIWAFDTWNNSNIEATLSDKRKLLPSEEYKEEFKEYCLYNIDLWMLTYEKDIAEEKSQEAAFDKIIMPRPRGAELTAQAREFEEGGNIEGDLPQLGGETEAM